MSLFSPARFCFRIIVAVGVLYAGTHILQERYGDTGAPAPAPPAAGASARSGAVPAGSQAAVVVRVVDGDTIEAVPRTRGPLPLGESATVRLLEIDTPETKKPRSPVACGGPAASAFTARLLPPGTPVALVPDRERTDRYGRALRYVYTQRAMVNLQIVRAGYARPLLVQPNDAHIGQVRKAARRARLEQRGMWATCRDPFSAGG